MAVSKNSLKNLTNISEQGLTKEQLIENGRKGGKKSGERKREKKEMKELLLDILNMNIKSGKAEDFKNLADSKGKNITVNQALILAQVKKAMSGDTRAMEFIRDTAGMKPAEKREIQADIRDDGKLDEIIKALNEDNNDNE